MEFGVTVRFGNNSHNEERNIGHYCHNNYSNKNAIQNVINYIMRGVNRFPEEDRIFGVFGTICQDDPKEIIREIMESKRKLGHNHGKMCDHICFSIGPNPSLSHDKLNKMVEKIAGFWKKRYIVFYGLHAENDITGVSIYHIHMMVSLSNYETGKKGDITPNTISKFQRKAKRILLKTLEKETHNKSSGE